MPPPELSMARPLAEAGGSMRGLLGMAGFGGNVARSPPLGTVAVDQLVGSNQSSLVVPSQLGVAAWPLDARVAMAAVASQWARRMRGQRAPVRAKICDFTKCLSLSWTA